MERLIVGIDAVLESEGAALAILALVWMVAIITITWVLAHAGLAALRKRSAVLLSVSGIRYLEPVAPLWEKP